MLQYRVYGDIYHNILSLVRFLKFSEKFSKNQNHVIWISFCQIWRYVQRFSCYLWSLCKTILCYVPFCSALNKPIFLCIVIALFTVFPTENKHIQARTLSAIHFFNGGKTTDSRHTDILTVTLQCLVDGKQCESTAICHSLKMHHVLQIFHRQNLQFLKVNIYVVHITNRIYLFNVWMSII